jgi:hypothetical protein
MVCILNLDASTFPWTTACSPYTMTFPGAETMKGGIMGDDCFLSIAGARVEVDVVPEGMAEPNCAGIESMGECSSVCVECDDVLRGWRLPVLGLTIITSWLRRASIPVASRGASNVFLRILPLVAIPKKRGWSR